MDASKSSMNSRTRTLCCSGTGDDSSAYVATESIFKNEIKIKPKQKLIEIVRNGENSDIFMYPSKRESEREKGSKIKMVFYAEHNRIYRLTPT